MLKSKVIMMTQLKRAFIKYAIYKDMQNAIMFAKTTCLYAT